MKCAELTQESLFWPVAAAKIAIAMVDKGEARHWLRVAGGLGPV